jgi:YaiO family outer membrane protein
MSNTRRRAVTRLRHVVLAVAVASTQPLGAQTPAQAPATGRRVDVFGDSHRVSGGFGDWTGIGSRIVVPVSARDVWFVETLRRKAFGDAGTYVGGANQHVWSDRWYSFLAVGAGTGDFVLPDLRIDASISRKWGTRQSVVSTLGATLVDAKLGYRDAGGFGAITAYVSPIVVVEGGVRVTRSTPGNVDATRGFGAITLGREGKAFVVARGSSGREGYQLLGPDAAVRRFSSHEGGVSWRQWLGQGGGFLVQGERYANPFYSRTGVTVGLFARW